MNTNSLYKLKCSACSGNTPKLNNDEINFNLTKLNKWEINEERKMIFKKFKFKNFKKSLEFVNIVGKIAEEESHHPDFSFSYSYCIIMIHTHVIKRLSINDFILASKIDLLSY